jgi:hypothetical protein
MSCAERRDSILLLRAGLLEGEEAEELRAHLRSGCTECGRYAAEARHLWTALELASEPVEVPAALKGRLMQRIAGAERGAAPREPRAAARRPSWGAALALAAGLAAVAAVATFGLSASRGPDPQTLQQLAELREARADLEEQLEQADEELAELEDRVGDLELELRDAREQVAMLRKPGLEIVSLRGTARQPEAQARVFWEWEDGYYCYLHAQHLHPTHRGEVYALWLDTESGDRLLVGSFEVGEDGSATLWVKLPGDTGHATRAVVTLESGEVTAAPKGEAQLVPQSSS